MLVLLKVESQYFGGQRMFEELCWRIFEEFVGMNLMKSSHCCCCCKLFKTTTAAQHPQHFNSQCTLSITYSKIHVEVQRIDIRQYTFYNSAIKHVSFVSYQDIIYDFMIIWSIKSTKLLSNTPLHRRERGLAKCSPQWAAALQHCPQVTSPGEALLGPDTAFQVQGLFNFYVSCCFGFQ